jgi:putative peptidoglycan lipid II flippase
MSSRTRQLVQATTLVMVFFILSRALGLAREIVISHQFGTSRELEAYLAAFRIPDLIFNLVAGGALGSAFIPPFAALLEKGDTRGSWRLATQVINLVFIATTAFAIVAAIFAEPLAAHTVATGFAPEQQELTASLMRLMLITPVVFGVSGIVMGILNAHHHFLLTSAAPAMYNLAIIAGALFLAPTLGVYGLALGVVAGAFLHLLIQVPWLIREHIQYTPRLGLDDEAVRTVVRLMLPRTAGIAAVQINFLINTVLASTLPEGRLAALNYAFLLLLLPEGVIAQSIATVLFPTFSRLAARGETDALRHAFSNAFRITLYLTIPASLGLFLLRTQLVQLLLQRGAFTAESTAQTAFALQFFALGLFAHSGLEILTRAFYSLHDTATPVKIGVVSVALNIALSLALLGPLAQGGLALANSIATILEMFTLLYLLRVKLGGVDASRILTSVAKIVIACAVMGVAILLVLSAGSAMNILITTGAAMAIGAVVYIGVTFILRSDEIALAWRIARQTLKV